MADKIDIRLGGGNESEWELIATGEYEGAVTSAVVTVALTSPRTAAMMSSNVDATAGSSDSLLFSASSPRTPGKSTA